MHLPAKVNSLSVQTFMALQTLSVKIPTPTTCTAKDKWTVFSACLFKGCYLNHSFMVKWTHTILLIRCCAWNDYLEVVGTRSLRRKFHLNATWWQYYNKYYMTRLKKRKHSVLRETWLPNPSRFQNKRTNPLLRLSMRVSRLTPRGRSVLKDGEWKATQQCERKGLL